MEEDVECRFNRFIKEVLVGQFERFDNFMTYVHVERDENIAFDTKYKKTCLFTSQQVMEMK